MKIALIAMSGVRVRSQELLEIGVTLPGFVERSEVIASLPSLGLLTLAGATPPHHEIQYYEHGEVTPEALADDGIDLVAISTFTAQAPEAYAYADDCRRLGLRIAMGGLHVTVCPDEALDHADHVLIGEGEEIWPELLRDLEQGRAQATYDARGRVFPLDRAPLPRYDLLDPEKYNRITIQTTRSCPHRCTFCASGILLRGPYRKKPIELVQRDLDAISAIWPQPFIELADDNTFVDKRWGKELVKALTPYQLKWFTESDITLADDPELMELLSASGCRQVLIGLEALDEGAVSELEDRSFKAKRIHEYALAVRRIQEHGISVNGCFILGGDTQTRDSFREIASFANAVGLAEVQVTVLTPFPGTPLYERLLAQGRILKPGDWGGCTLFDVTYEPARMSVRELEEGLLEVFAELYTAEARRGRQRRFFQQVRSGRRRREKQRKRASREAPPTTRRWSESTTEVRG
ncbi:MAG: radical SAM protein [Planctomycetota bacterium]|nr:radical SAM protein [Planctomycetota bacterium]